MASGRSRPLLLVPALAVTAATLLAACSLERSGYQFVRSPSTGTYLKVPSDWKVFDQKALEAQEPPDEGRDDGIRFVSVLDGDRRPSLSHDLGNDAPLGIVRVRDLGPEERDVISFATARQDFFPELNQLVGSKTARVHSTEEVVRAGAHGQRIVFSVADQDTGEMLTVDQTSLVDRRTSRLYLLVVACTTECYERNEDDIDAVATSLTIKER